MLNSSIEFEIKLLFPLNRLAAIEKYIISRGGVRRQHLQAAYIDTSDFSLAQAGIAFRLRKEGRQWVQTLKVSSANPLERLEHNIVLDFSGSAIPAWSLELHRNHESGKRLYKQFPKLRSEDLLICYQTDIWRRKALVNTRQGTLEYSLDMGFIYVNQSDVVARKKVRELEIELKNGNPLDVLRHAQTMINLHKAYIDTRSKSECGVLLARGIQASPPVRAKSVSPGKVESENAIMSCLLHSCLAQVLSNQNAINDGLDSYPEHLHQLRVGLRRIKVLLKYLARHKIFISNEGAEAFKRVFDKLGLYRDNESVKRVLNPGLISMGGPEIKLISIKELPNPCLITRDKEFQLLLLELISMGLSRVRSLADSAESDCPKKEIVDIKKTVAKLLDRRFYFVSDRASHFETLGDEEIHSLRKKMKFIRYSLEFFKDFCTKNKYSKFFKAISVALEYFGLFNDICISIRHIEGLAQDGPNLSLTLIWLRAERVRARFLCEKSVRKLVQTDIAWGDSFFANVPNGSIADIEKYCSSLR